MSHRRSSLLARAAFAGFAAFLAAGCSSSDGRFAVCGVTGSITAPAQVAASLDPVLRFHGTISTDSAWRERVVEELSAVRADTTVRLLFVHATAIGDADRARVTGAGGTIVEEPADWNGIVATFTAAAARSYAPTAPLDRVIDGHLVTERVLPPCD